MSLFSHMQKASFLMTRVNDEGRIMITEHGYLTGNIDLNFCVFYCLPALSSIFVTHCNITQGIGKHLNKTKRMS